jgi:hypothetical protein
MIWQQVKIQSFQEKYQKHLHNSMIEYFLDVNKDCRDSPTMEISDILGAIQPYFDPTLKKILMATQI